MELFKIFLNIESFGRYSKKINSKRKRRKNKKRKAKKNDKLFVDI
jgi:hypothetical protein